MGMWMFQMSKNMDGSFETMNTSGLKYRHLAFTGLACFYIIPLIDWIKKGMNINVGQVSTMLKEEMFPSFNRAIPLLAQLIRGLGAGLFMFSTLSSIKLVDNEIEFNFDYFGFSIIGAVLFFGLPFIFPKKDNS